MAISATVSSPPHSSSSTCTTAVAAAVAGREREQSASGIVCRDFVWVSFDGTFRLKFGPE